MVRSTLTGELFEAVVKDGKQIVAPEELQRAVETPRFVIQYTPVCTDIGHAAAECRITDSITGCSVTRVGEVTDDKCPLPVTKAYKNALYLAARDILMLEATDDTADDEQEEQMDDDELILIGNHRGAKFGDVKEDPQFVHFLGQLLQTRDLRFPDENRQKQLAKLLRYAEEVYDGE